MFDRFKQIFGEPLSGKSSPMTGVSGRTGRDLPPLEPVLRQSNGLEQFFNFLRDRGTLSLLDFAGASQENVSFITSMGHRLASEDFVRSMEQVFGQNAGVSSQSDPLLVDRFVSENLAFEHDSFDGALLWDGLQFLSPHLLQVTVDRLYESLRPNACLLAFFNADEKAREMPVYHYRISDHHTLSLTPRGGYATAQFFNNRSIERIFHRYASVKFFLARDSLREILVKR